MAYKNPDIAALNKVLTFKGILVIIGVNKIIVKAFVIINSLHWKSDYYYIFIHIRKHSK